MRWRAQRVSRKTGSPALVLRPRAPECLTQAGKLEVEVTSWLQREESLMLASADIAAASWTPGAGISSAGPVHRPFRTNGSQAASAI